MFKTSKAILVYTILLWGFYLFFLCPNSVQFFISDWHSLYAEPKSSASDSKEFWSRDVLMNLLILAVLVLNTGICIKAFKNKDASQSKKAWVMSKTRKVMLVISTILFWCFYLFFCYFTVRLYNSSLHFSQLMTQLITENKQLLTETDSLNAQSSVSNSYRFIVRMVLYNLGMLAMLVWMTKGCVDLFKNNNINNNGTPATQS